MEKRVFLAARFSDGNGKPVTDEEKAQAEKDVELLGMILPWASGSIEKLEEVRSMAHVALEQLGMEEEKERILVSEKKQMMADIAAEIKKRE